MASVFEIAQELGVSLSALGRWCQDEKTHGERAFAGSGHHHPEDDEVRRLRRENEIMQRTRAGMRDIPLSPQLLRHSFALRYLQAGGDPLGLQELFGYVDMAPVKQYLRWHEQLVHGCAEKRTEHT